MGQVLHRSAAPTRTQAHRYKSNCHQNCHSESGQWGWYAIVRISTKTLQSFRPKSCARVSGSICWEYMGARDMHGYGRVFIAGKEIKAQRVYFNVFVGPLPEGARLKHFLGAGRCIGSACCNPAHLAVEQRFTSIRFASRVCPKGHLIDNAVIENPQEESPDSLPYVPSC